MTPQIFRTATLSSILLAALQLRQHLSLTPVSNFLLWKPDTELLYTLWQVCAPMAQDKHQSGLKFNVSIFPLQSSPAQRWIFGGHFPVLQTPPPPRSKVNGPFVFGACLAVAQPRTNQLHR